jgi:hypothetical protein
MDDQEPANEIPVGIRIASVLVWVAGVVTILVALATDGATLSGPDPQWGSLILAIIIGGAVCWAGYLIRRQRRIGVLVLAIAWAIPNGLLLLVGETPNGGPVTVIIAFILVAFNWKHLK